MALCWFVGYLDTFFSHLAFSQPVFKKGITSMDQLQPGQHVSGSVTNVTSFGECLQSALIVI